MMLKPVRKFKWFWAWQDEKEEAWLGEMAKHGLHLESIPFPGLYQFLPGNPGDYIYRLDFQSLKAKDRDSYLQLFADAGWEHVGDMGGWVYFRHIVNGSEIPEIYSDLESKAGKYQRILTYLVIFLPIMVTLVPQPGDVDRYGLFSVMLEILGALLILLYSLAIVQLFRRIHSLRKSKTLS
jgi:hypothetical protein